MRSVPTPKPFDHSTAAAAFKLPAPASISPAPGTRELVNCSAAFTCAGVSCGADSSSSAAAPDTTAVDMLVPLNSMYAAFPGAATTRSGYVVDSALPAADADTMRLPGATRSGFSTPSTAVGPREL